MNDQDETSRRLSAPLRGAERTRTGHAPFGAQLLGMGGVRRGLRGGQVVLKAARAAYLETEWSGPADRRGSAGLLARRKV